MGTTKNSTLISARDGAAKLGALPAKLKTSSR